MVASIHGRQIPLRGYACRNQGTGDGISPKGSEVMTLLSEEAATCQECLNQEFTIDPQSELIRDLGKFQGELLATYHAYHHWLNGAQDEDVYFENGQMVTRVGNVLFEESENGFIYGDVFDTEELAIAKMVELEAESESETEEEETN
jgi:hypothetical protein